MRRLKRKGKTINKKENSKKKIKEVGIKEKTNDKSKKMEK